jgi:RNA polymerase sigma-70 factor (ECF subfamily)
MRKTMVQEDKSQQLVRKAQEGDRAAFDALISRYRKRLEALILSRLGAHLQLHVEVEDVLQETLIRAFKDVDRFGWQGDESFLRWLGGIAEHVIRTVAARYSKREKLRLDREQPADRVSPSKMAQRHERFDRLEEALQGLSEDHRRVILLARIEGVPIKEIARRMNRSESAVKNLLLRALVNLKSGFGDTESFHLPERRLNVGEAANEE